MPILVVTRLRLKDAALTDDFFTTALTLIEQAKGSPGNLGVDGLADARNVWWTATSWAGHDEMRSYVGTDPHRSAMSRLDEFCDEATFVDWEQDDDEIPSWTVCHQHLVEDGRSADLPDASPANASRDFPPPVAADEA